MSREWENVDHLQAHCDMLNRMVFTTAKGIEYFVFGAPPHRKIDTRPIRQGSLLEDLDE